MFLNITYFFNSLLDRGPLLEGWRQTDTPIMCSYKVVHASFEVWGLQTKVEEFIQRSIRDILLLGHRQAFAWIDEWHGMTMEDVRTYERQKQEETNEKLKVAAGATTTTVNGDGGGSGDQLESQAEEAIEKINADEID